MNPLPNIVVVNFIDWLRERSSYKEKNNFLLLDFVLDREDSYLLEECAEEFLQHWKRNDVKCLAKYMAYKFFFSEEYENIGKRCSQYCSYKMVQECYECDKEIYWAVRNFLKRMEILNCTTYGQNISPSDLVIYMRSLKDMCDENSSNVMKYLLNSKIGLASEIDFLEWLQKKGDSLNSVSKMPSSLYEKLVDEYILSNGRSEEEKQKLIKAYRETGWESLLKAFQKIFKKNRTRATKELSTIIDRYCGHQAKFNCIILPLSDSESQKQYLSLLSDNWDDLNELSDDYLDIYYSETDNGKSGYDIAKRIGSLPLELKTKAPCLIIWEDSIKNAKTIPIHELSSKQILLVFRCIVEEIQKSKKMDQIIKEAIEMAQDQRALNRGITIIEGDGNVVGNSNYVTVVKGEGNNISMAVNQLESEIMIRELEQAISLINQSIELNEAQKTQMCEIMQELLSGIRENVEEKKESAKNKFTILKSFFFGTAPKLVSALSDLSQIATFLGIAK